MIRRSLHELKHRRDEAGYVTMVISILIPALFIGLAATAVDTSRWYLEGERVQKAADAAEGRSVTIASVERFAFYELAKPVYAFVQTGETVPYSCYLLRKGVV